MQHAGVLHPGPRGGEQLGQRTIAPSELHARRALRGQVARLERQLAAAVAASFPDGGLVAAGPWLRPAPHVLSLGELERLRDGLAARVASAHALLRERDAEREDARVRLERMLLAPGKHRFVRITQRELGAGGCGVWHVKPRLGLIGMLAGWWHVKLSSGCPLAT